MTILDIGAYDVNASYRPLFGKSGWTYQGVDIAAGPNVDVVLDSVYEFPFESNSVDVIVSGQTFEHVEFFWLTWQEMARVLKPGGHIILIAPSRGQEHRFPVDCWRFYPDGFRALGKLGKLEVLEVQTSFLPVKQGLVPVAEQGQARSVGRHDRGVSQALRRVQRSADNAERSCAVSAGAEKCRS
ncbi:MAG: methyltransferase domain-containing protein [Chromatiales bacterium]|nr:methyltransferase domain-containing protein [Chromatiales bacterium]